MEPKDSELFTGQDFEDFTNWLNLKDFSQKWDSRVQQELEKFYLLFLSGTKNLNLFRIKKNNVILLFNEPLRRWFDWFLSKYCLYLCIFRDLSIHETIELFELNVSQFIEVIYTQFQEVEVDLLASRLTEENIYSNKNLKLKDLCENKDQFAHLKESCRKHPVYSSLDFTYYPEWKKCLEKLNSLNKQGQDISSNRKESIFKNFFYEFAIIFISIAFALGVFKVGNKLYNNFLSSKIEIYEPNFFWLDKDLAYKVENKQVRKLNLAQNELEKLEKSESQSTPFIDEGRETPESEVFVLTSENIPKNLKYISGEKSRYEEIKKGGFRDKIYGRRKAYRIILNSVEMQNVKEKIKEITERFETKEFGKVAMGQEIPGGSYFNLYVKEPELKDFLEEVVGIDNSSRLYVSKTQSQEGPEGYEKVFIWIKSI